MTDVGAPVRRQGPPVAGTIKDASRPGRRSSTIAAGDVPPAELPEAYTRSAPPGLPEVGEVEVALTDKVLSRQGTRTLGRIQLG